MVPPRATGARGQGGRARATACHRGACHEVKSARADSAGPRAVARRGNGGYRGAWCAIHCRLPGVAPPRAMESIPRALGGSHILKSLAVGVLSAAQRCA